MDIQLDASDLCGWRVVHLVGDLDVFAAADLTRELTHEVVAWTTRRSLEPQGTSPAGMVVDLQQVPFVDSSGLGVLISAYRRARGAGVPVHLVSTSEELLKTITMMGLTTVLPVFPDLTSATGGAAGGSPGAS